MRDMTSSDGSRLYALLANLCQSPISWYTSGPAQKFILRQIKIIDTAHGSDMNPSQVSPMDNYKNRSAEPKLDICLLMLYGHILFTSTSYTFALGEFVESILSKTNSHRFSDQATFFVLGVSTQTTPWLILALV